MINLDQKRAASALSVINSPNTKNNINRYRSQVRKLPALIQANGIIQVASFLKAKDDTKLLYQHLSNWIIQQYPEIIINNNTPAGNDLVLNLFYFEDNVLLLNITTESIRYAYWLKRMTECIYPEN